MADPAPLSFKTRGGGGGGAGGGRIQGPAPAAPPVLSTTLGLGRWPHGLALPSLGPVLLSLVVGVSLVTYTSSEPSLRMRGGRVAMAVGEGGARGGGQPQNNFRQ